MPVGNDEETAKNNPRENDHRQALVSSEEGDHRRCRLGFPEEHRGAIIGLELAETVCEFAHLIEWLQQRRVTAMLLRGFVVPPGSDSRVIPIDVLDKFFSNLPRQKGALAGRGRNVA